MKSLLENTTVRIGRGALLAIALALSAHNVTAAARYVDVNSTNPVPPFSTWATAATTIQDAVDAAEAGDEILVTNGVYETGASVALGTSRVTVTKAVAIRSVHGPTFTTIQGYYEPTNYSGAGVRCVYLGAGASLTGFALTNGGGDIAGGILCETNAVVSDCVIAGNRALFHGGGAWGGTLNHCTILSNRTLIGNGGGVINSVVKNCVLSGNYGAEEGGGASQSRLFNCLLMFNSGHWGGGASASTLVHCTVVSNRCAFFSIGTPEGGGIINCSATNSIVSYNFDNTGTLDNFVASSLSFSCTSPTPANGVGNITSAPLFVNLAGGDFRLQPGSPCIDAGMDLSGIISNDLAGVGRPLDGNGDGLPRFDMGAYEFVLNSIRYVNVGNTNPAPPYLSWATAASTLQEAVDAAMPGDEILVANGVYETGGRVVPGFPNSNRVVVTKPIAIRSINGPAFTIIRGEQTPDRFYPVTGVRCVYLGAGASLTGFTLTNGAAFGISTNEAARFGGGIQCETTTAIVSNCVIVGNAAWDGGGGANGGTLFQCRFSGNGCIDGGGGGAFNSTLVNCLLVDNWAFFGGGAARSTLVSCTVVSNVSAAISGSLVPTGGGVVECAVTNSIIHYNRNSRGSDNFFHSTLTYSCTSPIPTNGVGNITNAPLFVNASSGDFRLQPGSLCIDAGMDVSGIVSDDLAGLRRPLDGNRDGVAGFDMGAYEFNPLFLTSVSKIGANIRVCWFGYLPGMKLQTTPSIIGSTWSDVAVPPDATCMELPLTSTNRFFRLSLP